VEATECIGWGRCIKCGHFVLSKLAWLGLFQGFVGCSVIVVVIGGRGAVVGEQYSQQCRMKCSLSGKSGQGCCGCCSGGWIESIQFIGWVMGLTLVHGVKHGWDIVWAAVGVL